jgi:hypothetical protein
MVLILAMTQSLPHRSYKMYKLLKNLTSNHKNMVLRIADNTFIPFDPDNTDYQAYLKWLADGNTPEPAEEQQ